MGWVVQHPNAGMLLLQDPDSKINVTLLAVSKTMAGKYSARGAATAEARAELQKWIDTQRHVQVRQAPRLLSGAPYPTATAEGLQQRQSSDGSWYRRLLNRLKGGQRRSLLGWRFWGILNPHQLILANCYGQAAALEKHRSTLDCLIASIRLPRHDILMGRPFAEAVASLSRSCFPRAAVAVIDEMHLQFGAARVALAPLHRKYLARPEELPLQVQAYLAQVHANVPAAAGPWMRAREHVIPVFLTEKDLAEAREALVHETWINGLAIGYVLEQPTAANAEGETPLRLITEADLAKWSKDSQALHDQALQNLVLRSREQIMEGRQAEGLMMLRLAHPDRHNAARILLPELHRKLREHLGAMFYAAMPARDVLVAFNSSDEDILEQLRRDLEHDYRSAREPLSAKFFQVTPDGIAGDPIDAEDIII